MGEEKQKGLSTYAIAKRVCHEVLIEGQIASSGAHQARLIEKFKKDTNYIKHQFLVLKFVFAFLFAFLPIVPLFTYFGIEESFGSLSSNSISLISSLTFGIYFSITILYMLMFGMVSTSSFMSGNAFNWLRTLPFSKKDIRKIGLMSLFRNIDIPLIVLIAGLPITMLIGTQNILIFIVSLFISIVNVVFNFSLLVIIGEKLSFLFSESKGKSKKVNLIRIITMIGYFTIAFGSGIIFSFGISFIDTILEGFKTTDPPFMINIILSLIPFPFAPAYFVSLSTNPLQVSPELLLSTLIGLALFILLTLILLRSASRALRTTISAEIKIETVEQKIVEVEVKPTSPIKAYIRKDLISSTRDLQSFMFIFFPIFYPLIMIFSTQGVIINEVTTIGGLLILWSVVVGINLFIPPMLIIGFLNIEESGSSTIASLPINPRDQAKAKLILMMTIQGISLAFTTIVLTFLTNSPIVVLLFLATLPITWSFLLLMFVLKIFLFGKMKYKYIIEELNKEHKIFKWILMIVFLLSSYVVVLITGGLLFLLFSIGTTLQVLLFVGSISLSVLIFSFTRMFPKVEKMANYKTGGFLREHVNVGTLVILILTFIFTMFLPLILALPFLFILTQLPFIVLIFFDFFLIMGSLALLYLVVIPFGLKLPYGKETLKEFSSTIGLKSPMAIWKTLLIGIGSFLIFALISFIMSLLLGSYNFQFNFEVLFRPPNPMVPGFLALGWFRIIYMLRPGLWEEVAFRGIILNLQKRKYTQTTVIFLNGIIFGLFHYVNLITIPDPLGITQQVFFAGCLGIAFSYMYFKTKSIIPCITTHFLINAFGILFYPYAISTVNSIIYQILGISILPMIFMMIFLWIIQKKNR
jgi:membrane protease YdiL (CAAX protease family)